MLSERTRAAETRSPMRNTRHRVSDRWRAELGLGTQGSNEDAGDAEVRDTKVWPAPDLFFKHHKTDCQQQRGRSPDVVERIDQRSLGAISLATTRDCEKGVTRWFLFG